MCLGIEHHRFLSCSLYIYTLMDGFHLPIFHLTYMSFCTQGLPGVAESNASWMQGKPSPQGKGARYGGWGVMERVLPRSSLIIYDGFPTPGGQGWSFRWWILQLCLRLRAECQSVRHIAKNESFRTRETKQKEVWCCGHNFRWILFLKGIDREVLVGVERTIYIPPNETIFYNNINYIVEICLCATKLFAMKMELKLEHKKTYPRLIYATRF